MVNEIYPKNKEYFKKLILFAQRIIQICKENKIIPIVYGSFMIFYYTKNSIKVNDIDFYIPEKSFKNISKSLKKENINFNWDVEWRTIIIEHDGFKIELDSLEKNFKFWQSGKNSFIDLDFYGNKIRALSLNSLKKNYKNAFLKSDSPQNYKRKYELLKNIK